MITRTHDYLLTRNIDLDDYLDKHPNLYNTLNRVIKSNLDDSTKLLFKLIAFGLIKGYVTVNEVYNAIDFNNAPLEWMICYGELFGVPIPDFPTTCRLRTHQIVISGVNPDGNDIIHHVDRENYQVRVYSATSDITETYTVLKINKNKISTDMTYDNFDNKKILMLYDFDYIERSRYLCTVIWDIYNNKRTALALSYWLEILFGSSYLSKIEIINNTKQYPFYQYLRVQGNTGGLSTPPTSTPYNWKNVFFNKATATGLGFTRVGTTNSVFTNPTNPNLTGVVPNNQPDYQVTPRYVPGSGIAYSSFDDIKINITANLHDYIDGNDPDDYYLTKWIKDRVLEQFIPYPSLYGQFVQFNFYNINKPW